MDSTLAAPMNDKQVLKHLETAGTAQNRKVYARHGVGSNMYGVSFAKLNDIAKMIETDHELARRLWNTGNHDARILATMIADPGALSPREMDAWVKELDNYVAADAFAGMVAKCPAAQRKADKWCKSRHEWIGRAGWQLVAALAADDPELADGYFEAKLGVIREEIHTRKNQVRDAMNRALIAIGVRNMRLERRALAVASAVGKVEVDHGETSCKTPDAVAYIKRTVEYRARKTTKQRKGKG